jgi:hypothetical protein
LPAASVVLAESGSRRALAATGDADAAHVFQVPEEVRVLN